MGEGHSPVCAADKRELYKSPLMAARERKNVHARKSLHETRIAVCVNDLAAWILTWPTLPRGTSTLNSSLHGIQVQTWEKELFSAYGETVVQS